MSELIAKFLQPIPSGIFGLFRSVIKARSITYDAFQQILNDKPDPEIERNNATHKHFIESLTKAFNALGGKSLTSPAGSIGTKDEQDGDVDDATFENQFSAIRISGDSDGGNDTDVPSETESAPRVGLQRRRGKGKGKKGKRAKKSKTKASSKTNTEASLAEIPIESYRIIDDTDGIISEYLLAVYAVTREWSELRSCIQSLWCEVAYEKLNGAVAASVTSIAVGMVRQTSNAVFVDFPGHDSYETIMKTLTRGDPEWAQGNFGVALQRISADGQHTETVKETRVDIKEQIWVNTYYDLMAFLDDFQKNRSGKPTKAMQAQIGDWDPRFDLQRATNDERLKWRRAYTINWLYDLVNLFSSIVVQRNTLKGEHHVYENVNWSPSGPWHKHRRLFGLNEFAGDITGWAMQKQNTNVRQKISPHHVFQLQCIVDSFVASRGWTVSMLHGHLVRQPAHKFRPRRDVDLFLDREYQKMGRGFLQAAHILIQLLAKDAESHQHSGRHEDVSQMLEEFRLDFVEWLGESKYMYGLDTIPPSQFSKHNANGLWEYSPLLCAAGLVEGLVLSQRISMLMWDRMTEPLLVIHLHNLLVQRKFIKQPIGLYATLESLLEGSFFPDGVPKSDFYEALVKRVQGVKSRKLSRQRQAMSSTIAQINDMHKLMDINSNTFFRTKSALMKYYDADWVPDRIPDNEITFASMLGQLRLVETKQAVDSSTGKKRLEATELVQRFRAQGINEADLTQAASFEKYKDYKQDYRSKFKPYAQKKSKFSTGRSLLDLLRVDLFADVCGMNPLSSINYLWVTVHFMILFDRLEKRLREVRNPLYIRTYEHAPASMRRSRRPALIMAMMKDEDPDTLKLCAEVFQDPRMGIMGFIFWEDLRESESGIKKTEVEPDDLSSDMCSVM
ncbi:uncharacterized protein AB675_708 [Cyphellophora attinorum]|uniref:DUF6604 domain-containing protein n=1 Tax=Cyphellophora attinorum TaxID=1664694 RepID=A0A0N1HY32_9EURO|nr:uncharacterized protein AB675_708 [Phialophora attinorum]KPI45656.1 hypothetical protein AB675_708 [Phialophora attinorum]